MRRLSIAFVALLAVGLAACGGGAATSAATGPTITLDLKEFAFAPKDIEIPADQKVTIQLRNKGVVEHDLTIDAIGLKVVVKPGQTATRVVGPLAAGTEYEVHCSVAGHKDSGMTGKLVAK